MTLTQSTGSDPASSPAPAGRPSHPRGLGDELRTLGRLIAWTVLPFVALLLALAGLAARESMWESTEPIRYAADMRNAWDWGTRANATGYLGLYDEVVAENPDRTYGLDYVPLRLAVMSLWARQQQALGVTSWTNSRSMNAFLLEVNYASDVLAGLAVFALTGSIVRRSGKTRLVSAYLAVMAGAIFFLNPALTVSSFGRPTWDTWVLPFFLWACFAAFHRQWAIAGALIGLGAMFKGQQLIAVPFFCAWLFTVGGPRALLSFVAGVVLAVGVVVSPWIFTRFGEVDPYYLSLLLAALLLPPLIRVLLVRPAVLSRAPFLSGLTPSWRWTATMTLCLGSLVAVLAAFHPGASLAWFEVGFRYGADKFPQLELGGASSLAGLLMRRYRWNSTGLPFPHALPGITIKHLLTALFTVCALLAGLAAGLAQGRRSDGRRGLLHSAEEAHGGTRSPHDSRRLLIAIPALWICFFAFAPQMHERYLLWGALTAAMCVGVSPGLTVLGIALSVLSWAMTIKVMLLGDHASYRLFGYTGTQWSRWIEPTFPGAAFFSIVAAVTFLYLSFGKRKPAANAAAGSEPI